MSAGMNDCVTGRLSIAELCLDESNVASKMKEKVIDRTVIQVTAFKKAMNSEGHENFRVSLTSCGLISRKFPSTA
jgi:hypothetical protein